MDVLNDRNLVLFQELDGGDDDSVEIIRTGLIQLKNYFYVAYHLEWRACTQVHLYGFCTGNDELKMSRDFLSLRIARRARQELPFHASLIASLWQEILPDLPEHFSLWNYNI